MRRAERHFLHANIARRQDISTLQNELLGDAELTKYLSIKKKGPPQGRYLRACALRYRVSHMLRPCVSHTNIHCRGRFARVACNALRKPKNPGHFLCLIRLQMPFLDWETRLCYRSMCDAMNARLPYNSDAGRSSEELTKNGRTVSKMLIHQFLRSNESHLHIRRTFDQSYYSTATDTSARDTDQVMSRYSWKHGLTHINHSPMLMVNQCWLWVLNEC